MELASRLAQSAERLSLQISPYDALVPLPGGRLSYPDSIGPGA
jgi:hypothetical protein